MRRTLALLTLLTVVACWTGCAENATRSNDAPTKPAEPANASTPNMNRSATNSAPPTVGGAAPPSGIKPPMKDEKKK